MREIRIRMSKFDDTLTFASTQSFFVCLFGRDELKERPHFFMSFYEKRALDRDSRAKFRVEVV